MSRRRRPRDTRLLNAEILAAAGRVGEARALVAQTPPGGVVCIEVNDTFDDDEPTGRWTRPYRRGYL